MKYNKILSIIDENHNIIKKPFISENKLLRHNTYSVYQVMRKSDKEIFTINDLIEIQGLIGRREKLGTRLKKITIHNGVIECLTNGYFQQLHHLKKL